MTRPDLDRALEACGLTHDQYLALDDNAVTYSLSRWGLDNANALLQCVWSGEDHTETLRSYAYGVMLWNVARVNPLWAESQIRAHRVHENMSKTPTLEWLASNIASIASGMSRSQYEGDWRFLDIAHRWKLVNMVHGRGRDLGDVLPRAAWLLGEVSRAKLEPYSLATETILDVLDMGTEHGDANAVLVLTSPGIKAEHRMDAVKVLGTLVNDGMPNAFAIRAVIECYQQGHTPDPERMLKDWWEVIADDAMPAPLIAALYGIDAEAATEADLALYREMMADRIATLS